MIGPTFAWALLQAWAKPVSHLEKGLLVLCGVCLSICQMAVWFPPGLKMYFMPLQPMGALVLLVALGCDAAREILGSWRQGGRSWELPVSQAA